MIERTDNMDMSQKEMVLAYIEEFGSITQHEASRDLSVSRLAARISELKKQGYPIEYSGETVKNKYGKKCHITRYSMKQGERG